MSHHCLETEDLPAARALPAGDPRRREIDACPRCRSRLGAYDEFLGDASVPPGIDPASARAALDRAFAQAQAAAVVPLRRPARERSAYARIAWSGAAAAAIAAVAFVGLRSLRPGPGGIVLRETPPVAAAGPVLHAPATQDGAVVLAWSRVAGADAYAVELLDESLAPVARIGPLADTLVSLTAAHLPGGVLPGATLAWRVEALQQGAVIARSPTSLLETPRRAPR